MGFLCELFLCLVVDDSTSQLPLNSHVQKRKRHVFGQADVSRHTSDVQDNFRGAILARHGYLLLDLQAVLILAFNAAGSNPTPPPLPRES